MSDVKVVKFISGQEVIAKVISADSEIIVLESPLTVQPVRTQEGLGIGLVPFSFASRSKQAAIAQSAILCILDPEEELANQYLAGLAGLTLAPEGALPKVTLT